MIWFQTLIGPTEGCRSLAGMETRKCSQCGAVKLVNDFYVRKNGTLRAECKKCHNLMSNGYKRKNSALSNLRLESNQSAANA